MIVVCSQQLRALDATVAAAQLCSAAPQRRATRRGRARRAGDRDQPNDAGVACRAAATRGPCPHRRPCPGEAHTRCPSGACQQAQRARPPAEPSRALALSRDGGLSFYLSLSSQPHGLLFRRLGRSDYASTSSLDPHPLACRPEPDARASLALTSPVHEVNERSCVKRSSWQVE